MALLLALLLSNHTVDVVVGLKAYGHAYSRPNDFTADQFAQIAASFPLFTVEKAHAASVYGNASAPPPFATNSWAASVGTARKIKSLNESVQVLMYWNAALHFNFYECEQEVQESWLQPNNNPHKTVREYNYSVPAFREWWVRCAVDSVRNSSGALDGLFLDATPKVAVDGPEALAHWGVMVDAIRAALPPNAITVDNGFFLQSESSRLAGLTEWNHSRTAYVESLASAGDDPRLSIEESIDMLVWLSNSSARAQLETHSMAIIGHGTLDLPPFSAQSNASFLFGLAKFLLVANLASDGAGADNAYFLANNGYSIDDGLLAQPFFEDVYTADNAGCGYPNSSYFYAVPSVAGGLLALGHARHYSVRHSFFFTLRILICTPQEVRPTSFAATSIAVLCQLTWTIK